MRVKTFAVVVCVLFMCNKSTAEQTENAADASINATRDLYIILRNLVFPQTPLTSGLTSNRFVLLYPGKVLNYWDYYPGEDYEASLVNRNASAPEQLIPPLVMEKWFDIADVMVGADPFTGGVSGESLSRAYETILSQITVTTKAGDTEANYNMARLFLTSQVQDPENPKVNSTPMLLYDRYQNEYAQKKLEMEDKIENARQTKGSLEYELWFRRNYPVLNSVVEGAYLKWLTFGEKKLVELYKAYIDSGPAGTEVEEARVALRASELLSLDRTRNIYPVSFEPGNWYKYLLPDIKGPSHDMLIARKSMLESERDALQSMINFNNEAKDSSLLNNMEDKINSTANERDSKMNKSLSSMRACMQNSSTNATDSEHACAGYRQATQDAVTATFQHAQIVSEYESAAFLFNSKGKFNQFLADRQETLRNQIEAINEKLNQSDPYLGGVVSSRDFKNLNEVRNETEQSLDDSWTVFEYDSDSSHVKTEEEQHSLNVAVGLSIGLPAKGLSASGSAQYQKVTADLKEALKSASIKVSGEVLRVVIKRPWFKPSIFKDTSLSFVQHDEFGQKKTYVSPGPRTEEQFRNIVNGSSNNLYLLPEYVTSFLLARNVKLEFSRVDASSVSKMMQMMASATFSGSYDMFSASVSVGVGGKTQSVTADRTANGIIINIPGAQIIGYYTEVVPLFPASQT